MNTLLASMLLADSGGGLCFLIFLVLAGLGVGTQLKKWFGEDSGQAPEPPRPSPSNNLMGSAAKGIAGAAANYFLRSWFGKHFPHRDE